MKRATILYTAVKALIKNDEGKVLVLKQADPTITGDDQYHPPGGIIELGETIEECIIREIREEIGVDSTVERLFDVGEWFAERNDDVMQFVGLFYVCKLGSTDFKLQESEVGDISWVGVDEIDSFDIVEPSKSIIKQFLESA